MDSRANDATALAQRTPADEPGAQQGGQRDVGPGFAERKYKARIGDGFGGETTVAAEARELGALAHTQVPDAGTQRVDAVNDFVARDDGQRGIGQFAVDHVQIRAADSASGHGNAHLARSGLSLYPLRPCQRAAQLVQDHRLHGYKGAAPVMRSCFR